MTQSGFNPERFSKVFLLILALAISAIFFAMIRGFLTALLLAAILAGLTAPVYRRFVKLFRGREGPASAATLLMVLLVIILPLSGFLGLVAKEAVEVSQKVSPTIEQLVMQPTELDRFLERLPFYDRIEPYQDLIVSKIGDLAGRTGTFLVNTLAATTRGTARFFFGLFIMLYALFFFLIDGRSILDKILYYMPLSSEDEQRMVGKFVSVTRATLKGSLIIGIVQGGLAGAAFAVAGIDGAIFWGTIMAVLSIIPGVGAAIVWIPAVIYLFAIGRPTAAIGLTIWCAGLVGTIDNFMRPKLIGKDTKMPDLLILLSTLGGIIFFGALGFIIGPIVAALFVTVWDIYGTTFKDVLPPTGAATAEAGGDGDASPG